MRKIRRAWLCAAIVVLTVIPLASIAQPSCSAQVDPSSGSLGDLLLSVTGPPERAVAVGMHFVGGDGSPFVAERVGETWEPVRVPTEPGARTIELQDATADGRRVWAVGAFRNDRPQAGWVSGGTWHWTHPIDPGDGEDELLGVATSPDGIVWAVGKHQVGTNYQPLVERFDGAAWSVVTVPEVRGSAVLKDVAVGPDGVVIAVGWSVLPGGVTRPLILRAVHDRWVVDEVAGDGLLSGIAIQPSQEPIAVGWAPGTEGDRMIAFDMRSRWRPTPGTGDEPGRLAAVTSGEATVAVGTRFVDGVPVPTLVRLQTGEGWVPVDVAGEPAPETGGDQLLGVTGDAGSFLAVGIRDATDAFASLVVTGDCVS